MYYLGKHYYKIDVMGANGYSFMVCSADELDEGEVVNRSLDAGFFDDSTDADYSVVDDFISEHDILHFKNCGCCNDI